MLFKGLGGSYIKEACFPEIMKVWIAVLCILLVACASQSSETLVAPPSEPMPTAPAETITAVIGTAALVSGTVTINGVAAKQGSDLHEGDVVVTGTASKANLEFFDGAVLRLDAGTSVTLTQITKDHVKIDQASGQTYTRLLKLAGVTEYEVETSTTIASVRGTGFKVSIIGDDTEVGVGEGEVEVSTKREGAILKRQLVRKAQHAMMRKAALDTIEPVAMDRDAFMDKMLKDDDTFIDRMVKRFETRHPRIVRALKNAGYTDADMHQWMRDLATGTMTPEQMKAIAQDAMQELKDSRIQVREAQTN